MWVEVPLGRRYTYDVLDRITTARRGTDDANVVKRYVQYDALSRISGYDDVREWQERELVCPTLEKTDCYWETTDHSETLRTDTFTYDKVGNRTDKGAVLETGNRLTSFNGYTLQYDADGNLTRKSKPGAEDFSFVWSSTGQLMQVTDNNSLTTVTFGYDAFGRRTQKTKTTHTVNGTTTTTTAYLWDGDDLMAELDGAGNLIREYAYYPGIDRPHSVRRASDGAVFYYTSELPGHVTGLVNPTNQVVNKYEYTPWGEPISTTEQVVQPLRYAAREYDAETKLYFVRARYYDPVLGRFISEDPIGLAGGINPFAHTDNDPVNRRDPLGLESCPSGYDLVIVIDVEAETAEFRCEPKGGGSGGYSLGTMGFATLDPVTVEGSCGICGPYNFEPGKKRRGPTWAGSGDLGLPTFLPPTLFCVLGMPCDQPLDGVAERTLQQVLHALDRALPTVDQLYSLYFGECGIVGAAINQGAEGLLETLLWTAAGSAKQGGVVGFGFGVAANSAWCGIKNLAGI